MSWVLVVGSVSGNSAKGPEICYGFAFDVETPHSRVIQEYLSETVSVKIRRVCTEVQCFCCFGCMALGKCLHSLHCYCPALHIYKPPAPLQLHLTLVNTVSCLACI